jgi:NAD(P)-dependent dehydrogenase (short-subunit alcohol dehydrogenase family)
MSLPLQQRRALSTGGSRGLGAAEEIAALGAYLAGPEAGFVTGASLTLDGGFTASSPGQPWPDS